MEKSISLIIPNYNGSSFIGKCLEAAFASKYANFEVIVVDDHSTDASVEIIRNYPCTLVLLDQRSGAGAARNAGARNSKGELLFFIDADCMIRDDALSLANQAAAEQPGAVIGGTYTPLPFDADFFSAFQSLFIHYSETKKKVPDYVAGHAMIMGADLFRESNGFPEGLLFQPEDVAFSHQLRKAGVRLVMQPAIQVQHRFDFSLGRSLGNAYRKSRNWTVYSLMNKDLLADSGTASAELKTSAACLLLNVLFVVLGLAQGDARYLFPVLFLFAISLSVGRGLIKLFYRVKGFWYAVLGALYFAGVYPLWVMAGGLAGMVKYALMSRKTC